VASTIMSTEAVAQNERGYVLLSSERIKCQLISAATEGTRKLKRWVMLKLKTAEFIGSRFPVTQTQRTKIYINEYLGKGGMLKYFLDIYVPPIVPVVVTSKACGFARYRVVGMPNDICIFAVLTNSIVYHI